MGQTGARQVQVRRVGVHDGKVESGTAKVDGFAKPTPVDLGRKAVARVDGRSCEFIDRGRVADRAGLCPLSDNGTDAPDSGKVHTRPHLFLL
jgi:hypothetical protein